MNNQDLIVSQIRQRLEILYQMVDELEGGGSSGDAYTKAQTDALLALKADKSSTYTKSEVNTALSNKANTSDVNEIFAIDDITIEEGESLSSDLTDWLRLHKPLNLNGVEFYFSEESGVDYIYKAIEADGALPKFSVAQILKGNFRVQFYETTVDLVPTEDSINLITSDAVYDALSGKQNTTLTSYTVDTEEANITSSSTVVEGIEQLDYRSARDKAALVEIVDGGAKNRLTESDFTGTTQVEIPIKIPAGTYVISYGNLTSNDTSTTTCLCRLYDDSGGSNVQRASVLLSRGDTKNTVITVSGDTTFMRVYASDNAAHSSGDTVSGTDFMVCSKADWDISQAYQPYRPTYQELYDMVKALQPTT